MNIQTFLSLAIFTALVSIGCKQDGAEDTQSESTIEIPADQDISYSGKKLSEYVDTLLNDSNWHRRIRAAETLGRIGANAEPAVPALILALDNEDEDPALREAAARAIGDIGSGASSAIPKLIEMCGGEDENVAFEALKSIGESAIEPLTNASNSKLKWKALEIATAVKSTKGIPIAREALANQNLRSDGVTYAKAMGSGAAPLMSHLVDALNSQIVATIKPDARSANQAKLVFDMLDHYNSLSAYERSRQYPDILTVLALQNIADIAQAISSIGSAGYQDLGKGMDKFTASNPFFAYAVLRKLTYGKTVADFKRSTDPTIRSWAEKLEQ